MKKEGGIRKMGEICEFCENPEPWSSVGFCLECGKDFCDKHGEDHPCTRINQKAIDHFNKQVKQEQW